MDVNQNYVNRNFLELCELWFTFSPGSHFSMVHIMDKRQKNLSIGVTYLRAIENERIDVNSIIEINYIIIRIFEKMNKF